MVEILGSSLIVHQLNTLKKFNFEEIIVVGGYLCDKLFEHIDKFNVRKIVNYEYESSNMIYSLYLALSEIDKNDDIIVLYSDILYNSNIINKLINDKSNFSTVVDSIWEELWKMRMDNPLEDAESLKLDKEMNIIDIGNKECNITDIMGQYIGISKFSSQNIEYIYELMNDLKCRDVSYFMNMYMTDFLQMLINHVNLHACIISGGWFEIDTLNDINAYTDYYKKHKHIHKYTTS
jgi:choline kinase